jgi:catechol 2,3-dioxygenase-like lactoylglutathione lyase family enzyme
MPVRPVPDQINLVSADVEASVAFYRLLGLEIPDTDPDWQARHRSATGSDGIDFDIDSEEFAQKWDPGWNGGKAVVSFRVPTREAVDECHALLTAAGHPSQAAPYDAFWGARYAIVEDPDGNMVGIMSPSDPDRRSAPPAP